MKDSWMRGIAIALVILLFVSSYIPYQVSSTSAQESAHENEKGGLLNSAWPTYKHDVRRTGRSQYDTSNNPGVEKWKFEVKDIISSPPTIGKDGIIYIGTWLNTLYAIYPNGSCKWTIKVSKSPTAQIYAPSIGSDGTLYVPSNVGLYAFYPNGTLKWKFKKGGDFNFPVVADDGTIYVSTIDRYLYAIYPNGTLKWEFKMNSPALSPTLGPDGTIYAPTDGSTLYAVYPNGTLKWRFRGMSGAFFSNVVIGDDGIVYVANGDRLHALYPNGTVKWSTELPTAPLFTPSLGPDGTIYVPGPVRLTAVSPNGSIKWVFVASSDHKSSEMSTLAIGKEGTIYFGFGRSLYAVNPDGTLKWKIKLTTDIKPSSLWDISCPAIGEDGTVYVCTWLDREGSGTIIWGYLHAIGPGPERKVSITRPEKGCFYINNVRVIKTPFKKAIVVGDIDIEVDLTFPDEVERIMCVFVSDEPLLPKRTVQHMERGIKVEPPYVFHLNSSLLKYTFHTYTLQVVVNYRGGCTASDEVEIFFIHKPPPEEELQTVKVKWTFKAGSWITSSPKVVDGKVYFGSYDHNVYCLDAENGELVWKFKTDERVTSSPCVVDGKVYIGSYDNNLYCLDAETGKLIWKFETDRDVYGSPVVSGNYVYFGSADHHLYCLDKDSGEVIWIFETRGGIYSTPAVADGKVYVGSYNKIQGAVYCLDSRTGELIWSRDIDISCSSPAVEGGKIYIGSEDGKLYCLDAENGKTLWTFETGVEICSSPVVYNDKVYIGSLSYLGGEYLKLYCIDAETGWLIWDYQPGSRSCSESGFFSTVVNGKVYTGCENGRVYCFDAESGKLIWSYNTGKRILSTPAVVDGRIYVGSTTWKLYCLEEVSS